MNEVSSQKVAALQAKISQASATVCVIGLGTVGSLSARLCAASGFNVIGLEHSVERIAQVRSALDGIELSCDPSMLAHADVVMVAVRASSDGGADVEPVRAVFETIRQHVREPVLVLLESTVPPGTTRRLAEACFGAGSVLAALTCHCPERLKVGDDIAAIRSTPRIVGSLSRAGGELAAKFVERLGLGVVPVSAPETSELAKLLENAFLTTGIALMGEVTRIAHALGVSAREVAAAAATKPHGYFAFQPGAGIGGHCLINDLQMLRSAAASAGIESEMLEGVEHAAGRLNGTIVRRLEGLLEEQRIPFDGASICIVGVGFKPGSPDVTNSAAVDVARELLSKGASISYADSLVPEFSVDGRPLSRVVTPLSLPRTDAVLLLSGDPQLDVESLAGRVPVVLDAGGGRIMRGNSTGAVTL